MIVTHSGPLSPGQQLWVAVLAGGPGAALCGPTAASLGGLRGFDSEIIYVRCPHEKTARRLQGVHFLSSRSLERRLHPSASPPRARIPVALVESADLARAQPRRAAAILIAGVQQRLVRTEDLRREVLSRPALPNRALLLGVLNDVAGGSHALPEVDFMRLVRRRRLPRPDSQAVRRDRRGRRRWLDAYWKRFRLAAEIDGRGHLDVFTQWDDAQRDNDLALDGVTVLRFPSIAVRLEPDRVADTIERALRNAGWRPDFPGR